MNFIHILFDTVDTSEGVKTGNAHHDDANTNQHG